MPRTDRPLPPDLRRAPFAVTTALDRGWSVDELRRARLRTPTPGVRVSSPAPDGTDVRARCLEVLPALPADAVFSDSTALALVGVDLPFGIDLREDLHVQVGPGTSFPRRSGVRGHRRATPETESIPLPGGLRVVLPERAWVQLAARLSGRELVVCGDALMRRQGPVSSLGQLRGVVDGLPAGARGVRRLRAALDATRPGTDSNMETRLRLTLVDGGLACPEVNLPVRSQGIVVARPDLSYPAERIAIEYDGDVHRTDRRTWRRDVRHRQELESLGWRVISCTADDVLRHPAQPVAWARRALSRARHDLAEIAESG